MRMQYGRRVARRRRGISKESKVFITDGSDGKLHKIFKIMIIIYLQCFNTSTND